MSLHIKKIPRPFAEGSSRNNSKSNNKLDLLLLVDRLFTAAGRNVQAIFLNLYKVDVILE